MFTGLIEDVGQIVELAGHGSDGRDLVITTRRLPVAELTLGDSVAVNGVCLTVTKRGEDRFGVTVGPESLDRTTLRVLQLGTRVNLERALRVGDRLGGHLVTGHVDAVGTVAALQPRTPGLDLTIAAQAEVLRHVVEKGSITIDGVSLTVNRVDGRSLSVGLIPHTMDLTTLVDARVGSPVNIETDLIGKHVAKLLEGGWPDGR